MSVIPVQDFNPCASLIKKNGEYYLMIVYIDIIVEDEFKYEIKDDDNLKTVLVNFSNLTPSSNKYYHQEIALGEVDIAEIKKVQVRHEEGVSPELKGRVIIRFEDAMDYDDNGES
ncbi:hypothetical protein [Aureispira anguillae]|uniref:Uncharacterized protein n=1 Tax=Aureispira anguillae TaxID=2864201 RepID=A0A915YH46_9BACT|nr:hypothetical protein [Aureispira anguillae]BDS12945.1 hypothetical protein AsAng_0036700 [Aureispira anguillae]